MEFLENVVSSVSCSMNAAKRKKRKTRKCLDEIRKRSRRTGQIMIEKGNENFYSKNNQKYTITDNRLTLRMFPNAIRSKTITRPALIELEKEPNINIEELVKRKVKNATMIRIPINDLDCRIEFSKNNNLHATLNEDNVNTVSEKNYIVTNIEGSGESIELFSSMDELTNKSPNSLGMQTASTITSSSTQNLHDDKGYSLYEEFMTDIPLCLQQNSELDQEDVMKKTKILLQNLYIESCYQECENNIFKCIKDDKASNVYLKNNEVVHNPMDYIKLGHLQQQEQFSKVCELGSGSCSTSPFRASAPSSPSDTSLGVIIDDTPDYAYYPHRLN